MEVKGALVNVVAGTGGLRVERFRKGLGWFRKGLGWLREFFSEYFGVLRFYCDDATFTRLELYLIAFNDPASVVPCSLSLSVLPISARFIYTLKLSTHPTATPIFLLIF